MQGGEQPCFHFGFVTQLMPLAGPDTECLLGEVARFRLVPGETEGKLIQHPIIRGHKTIKVQAFSHIATSNIGAPTGQIVPNYLAGDKCRLFNPVSTIIVFPC